MERVVVHGQWIGPFKGTNEGIAIVELDDMGDHFEGSVYAYSADPALPSLWAYVRTKDNAQKFVLNLKVKPIDMVLGLVVEWDQVKDRYPATTLSPDLETNWEFTADEVHLSWKTPVGTNGRADLLKSRATHPSQYKPNESIKSWAAFKEFTVSLEPQRYVFRGQESSAWRLVTYFHRCGRFDLLKFVNIDIPQLHAHLSSLTLHRFRLEDALDNASFYSLAQHHGYPTPLLDWTFSPSRHSLRSVEFKKGIRSPIVLPAFSSWTFAIGTTISRVVRWCLQLDPTSRF